MKLVLIGCGKMGSAMLAGWLEQGIPASDIRIVEQAVEYGRTLEEKFGVTVVNQINAITEGGFEPELILLAVKPQGMDEAAKACAIFKDSTTFLSIAAGKTVSYFEGFFGADSAIIRVMPNTPAAVGRGISAAFANKNVKMTTRSFATQLLEAIGEVCWIDDEDLMDPVTAVSGSGPAYVFYLTECLAAAGVKSGLPEDLAVKLARATVAGAGELMRQSGTDAGELRVNVTSPGGTTAAALAILMDEKGMGPILEDAVAAATKRSRELAG